MHEDIRVRVIDWDEVKRRLTYEACIPPLAVIPGEPRFARRGKGTQALVTREMFQGCFVANLGRRTSVTAWLPFPRGFAARRG
jgi:hypothetical protein